MVIGDSKVVIYANLILSFFFEIVSVAISLFLKLLILFN
jgi:hypothetical protein